MKKITISLVLVFLIVGCIPHPPAISNTKIDHSTGIIEKDPIAEKMLLPEGFRINVFASDFGKSFNLPGPNKGARFMEFYNDVLFLSIPSAGKIVALPDENLDGRADKVIEVISGLSNPHGIAFNKGFIYIANEKSVVRIKMKDDLTADKSTLQKLVDLPSGGHWTRTIRIKDEKMYVSVGSSCNACIESDERRATILQCSFEGECRIYAKGSRNAVGFVFHPATNDIYATENSRDWLGDDLPPDEINIIRDGKDYGWPHCFGQNVPDFDNNDGKCDEREPSFVDLQAHSAPLGLAFNDKKNFPEEYLGKLFVAFHGSWNRKTPTGYKIVMIDPNTKKVSDFATGWIDETYKVSGRPVDIVFDKNGIMYVSDDNAGIVYRIRYEK